jgi:hypothetical protein
MVSIAAALFNADALKLLEYFIRDCTVLVSLMVRVPNKDHVAQRREPMGSSLAL